MRSRHYDVIGADHGCGTGSGAAEELANRNWRIGVHGGCILAVLRENVRRAASEPDIAAEQAPFEHHVRIRAGRPSPVAWIHPLRVGSRSRVRGATLGCTALGVGV